MLSTVSNDFVLLFRTSSVLFIDSNEKRFQYNFSCTAFLMKPFILQEKNSEMWLVFVFVFRLILAVYSHSISKKKSTFTRFRLEHRWTVNDKNEVVFSNIPAKISIGMNSSFRFQKSYIIAIYTGIRARIYGNNLNICTARHEQRKRYICVKHRFDVCHEILLNCRKCQFCSKNRCYVHRATFATSSSVRRRFCLIKGERCNIQLLVKLHRFHWHR